MGQTGSIEDPNAFHNQANPIGYLTESQLNDLFVESCLKTFDAYELYCLKTNLSKTNKEIGLKTLINIDTLNEFLNISPTCSGYTVFYKFLKQLSNFPILEEIKSPINFEFFKLEEIIKVITLLSDSKRLKILKEDYDIGKLIFIIFNLIGSNDGITECKEKEEESFEANDEKPKNSASGSKSFQILETFNEKTGEVIKKYPIFDNLLEPNWKKNLIINMYFDFNFNKKNIPTTYFLNFLTILLLLNSSIIQGYYKSKNLEFEEILIKIYKFQKVNNYSKDTYNLYKVHSFKLIKSICFDKNSKDLLTKRSIIKFDEYNFFLQRISKNLFYNNYNYLANLFLILTFNFDKKKFKNYNKEIPNFEETKLMTIPNLIQISLFLTLKNDTSINDNKCSINLNNLKNLYIGSKYGFSMKSFEYRVFNWNAPTILLISGKKITNTLKYEKINKKFSNFSNKLPNLLSNDESETLGENLIFGVYIKDPWKKSSKKFQIANSSSTILFELSSKQLIFPSKRHNLESDEEFVGYFEPNGGIGFGCDNLPEFKNGKLNRYSIGNISMILDINLEFLIFNHQGLSKKIQNNLLNSNEKFQDVIIIKEIEVWGIGSDLIFQDQLSRWQWEERESERRKNVNLKNFGDERSFLEMAGIINNSNHNGGSI